RLNLRHPEEIKEAAAQLAALGSGQVLVEAMAPEGVELILGFHHDPELGPVVMIGLGGIMAELYRDVVFRLAPLGVEDARAAIEALRGHALLKGFRGKPLADVNAAAEAVARVSSMFAHH